MTMDVMAGVGGMMGQLAVGIAGGDQTGAVMMASKMQMMKTSNIDSLPDKVSLLKISIMIIRLQYYYTQYGSIMHDKHFLNYRYC